MIETKTVAKKNAFALIVSNCSKRVQTPPDGYRIFASKEPPGFLHNVRRGASSIKLFPETYQAIGGGHYTSCVLRGEAAIADDWYMIGNDLCYSIVTFDGVYHERSAAKESEDRGDAILLGATRKSI